MCLFQPVNRTYLRPYWCIFGLTSSHVDTRTPEFGQTNEALQGGRTWGEQQDWQEPVAVGLYPENVSWFTPLYPLPRAPLCNSQTIFSKTYQVSCTDPASRSDFHKSSNALDFVQMSRTEGGEQNRTHFVLRHIWKPFEKGTRSSERGCSHRFTEKIHMVPARRFGSS